MDPFVPDFCDQAKSFWCRLCHLTNVWLGRHLLSGEWDYDEFRRKHLASYLGMVEEYMEEIRQHDAEGDGRT